MGTRIDVQTPATRYADSQAWLANMKGTTTMRSITVDLALFTADHVLQGFIPSGTVLGKVTATGKYGPYDNAASNGLEVAAGHLWDAIQMTAGDTHDVSAALFWEGIVRESKLPAFADLANAKGELDANAKTDLIHIRYE